MTRPQTTEAASYYYKYIDLITNDEIVPTMESQMAETLQFLEGISEEQSLKSYAPGKWTIRELLNHVNDGERVFLYRAFWFARGFRTRCRALNRMSRSRRRMQIRRSGPS